MSDSLQPHGLQHARLSCPSPTPSPCSNSHPSSWWCPPTISSAVIPFPSYLQSFPALGSFLVSQLFASDGQSFEALASASVLPINIQCWLHLGLTDLSVQGTLNSLIQYHSMKASIFWHSAFLMVQTLFIHDYGPLSAKWCLCFLISCLSYIFFQGASVFQFHTSISIATVTSPSDFGAQENKVCHCFHFFPIYLPGSNGTCCHDLHFLNADF